MSDAYWRYSDSRQPPPSSIPPVSGKRLRSDFDAPGSQEFPSYYSHEGDRGAPGGMRDTDSINASYDRYLRSAQISSFGGGQSARPVSGEISGHSIVDPRIGGVPGVDQGAKVKERAIGFGFSGARPEIHLPPDASSTLFVEGLPANCTRREVAHIFRPFVGYKEVRLVSKESRRPGGDPLVLCFVDFVSPAHAATAMDALQGYKFDEHDPDSFNLRLQFARHPGVRSGGGHRGKR